MKKYGVLILVAASLIIIALQFRTTSRLRAELAAAREENGRLPQEASSQSASDQAAGAVEQTRSSSSSENKTEAQTKQVQELETEVMRLRGAASRALRAEAEVAQLKSRFSGRQHEGLSGSDIPDAGSNSNVFLRYLGEAIPAPPNIDPAYTKDGLQNAIQKAAELAGVAIKKLQIETSEFPFLAGVVCGSDAEFEKLKEQFRTMTAYQYTGATSSHGVYAFNITPHRVYPPDTAQQITRRTNVRREMFFEELNSGAN